MLDGKLWYTQQAGRAVNQAVGRVIRHKYDYGAIILADRRFNWNTNADTLSAWLRPHRQQSESYGKLQADIIKFFKNASLLWDKYDKNKAGNNNNCNMNSGMLENKKNVIAEINSEINCNHAMHISTEMKELMEREGVMPGIPGNYCIVFVFFLILFFCLCDTKMLRFAELLVFFNAKP